MGSFKVEGERSIIYLSWYIVLTSISGMERSQHDGVVSWFLMCFVTGHCVEIYILFVSLSIIKGAGAFQFQQTVPAATVNLADNQQKHCDRFFSVYFSFTCQCTSVPYSFVHLSPMLYDRRSWQCCVCVSRTYACACVWMGIQFPKWCVCIFFIGSCRPLGCNLFYACDATFLKTFRISFQPVLLVPINFHFSY